MTLIKQHTNLKESMIRVIAQRVFIFMAIVLFPICQLLTGCSDFVEEDPPKNILVSETVFNDPATVESALANIYYQMREKGVVSGNFGLTAALGIYSDELDYYGFDNDYSQIYNHRVLSNNQLISTWWSHSYYLIYCTNDIIKGVDRSDALTSEEKNKFNGQALFFRAYVHSLLGNVYGSIPYVTTTNYEENNTVSRLPLEEVYQTIIKDLNTAKDVLDGSEGASDERVIIGSDAVHALLARMYLYTEQWELAEAMAHNLIDLYSLEPNLNEVFLKESTETIWQLKSGVAPRNTQEANQLVIRFIPGQKYALTQDLLGSFEKGDLRYTNWVGRLSNSDHTSTLYFPHKYKAILTETERLEYSIQFRVAEQYLIRAEARAQRGDIAGAQKDINVLRIRAGLPNTTASNLSELMDAILQERRVELFAEQGHRWFDLKRTGNANAILNALKPNWKVTDVLFPIPEAELQFNPNLLPQNNGYSN